MHRIVAAHLLAAMEPGQRAARRGEVIGLMEAVAGYAEDWRKDRGRFWMLSPLATLAEHLAADGDDRLIGISLGMVGNAELTRGLFLRAQTFLHKASEVLQRLFDDSPNDAQAARDLSVSLTNLGDFYQRRGQAGDQARALGAYQKSLAIDQRLFDVRPDDAQAARDLSVSQWRVAHLFANQDRGDDAAKALAVCFELLDQFHREGRPMDEWMRAVHAQLESFLRGGRPPKRPTWLSRLQRLWRR